MKNTTRFTTRPADRDHEHRARRRRWCRRRPDAGPPRPARSPPPRRCSTAFSSDARISSRNRPKVRDPSCDARFATTMEPRARAMATPSVSMWAASESRARDPVTNAVTASTTTKVAVSTSATQSRPDVAGGGAAQGVAVVVTDVRGGAARGRGPSPAFSPPGCPRRYRAGIMRIMLNLRTGARGQRGGPAAVRSCWLPPTCRSPTAPELVLDQVEPRGARR